MFVLSPAEGSSEEGRSCNVTSSSQIDEKNPILQTEILSAMKGMV